MSKIAFSITSYDKWSLSYGCPGIYNRNHGKEAKIEQSIWMLVDHQNWNFTESKTVVIKYSINTSLAREVLFC